MASKKKSFVYVRINPKSDYYDQGVIDKFKMLGKASLLKKPLKSLMADDDVGYGLYKYMVHWSDGSDNTYRTKDLIFINKNGKIKYK